MSVEFCGIELDHPVINGSGTFDAIAAVRVFGERLREDFPFSAYVSKTITLQPRAGNPPPRLWESAAGLINSIGLPNKGLDGYMREDLPQLALLRRRGGAAREPTRAVPLITNVMGASAEELERLVAACEQHAEIAAVELNVSCPNVSTGLDIGADPRQLEEVVRAVRPHTAKPLIVKLTPNTADVALCARAAAEAGRRRRLADQHAPRDRAGPGERRGALARRRHRRAVGAGDPCRGARAGRRGRRGGRDSGGRDGRRAERGARARLARRRCHARRRRDRVLPRPCRGSLDRGCARVLSAPPRRPGGAPLPGDGPEHEGRAVCGSGRRRGRTRR